MKYVNDSKDNAAGGSPVRVALDAFGGDHAPDKVILGAAAAVAEINDMEIILTGDEKTIKSRMEALGVSDKNITIVNADGVIEIEDDPMLIRTVKKESSMGKAFGLVASGRADAFVSAGSTAAMVVGATTLVGRMKGVKRPALAPLMPGISGYYMLLDGGANMECRAEMLAQFGVMGSIFMQKIMGVENPRVGLLNVGSEREKGRELEQKAYEALKNSPVNFIGNIEGRDPTMNLCDVAVTDGFTGNIYLKAIEGMGAFMKASLRGIFTASAGSKVGYLLSKKGVKALSKKTDYREVGGSPLLGIKKPVIKAHGSSDERAFKNAIHQAVNFCGAIGEIEAGIAALKEENQ
ncbi:MAG: phosphate acyltransferase PlsX [Oscillospiraceae bacterium]|nr:phosphate acyltransferase PlsX [Oscillospiraceae bacterium]